MTAASRPDAEERLPGSTSIPDMIVTLRGRAQEDPAAALELADALSLFPHLAHAGEVHQLYQSCGQAGLAQGQAAMAELAFRRQDSVAAHAIWRNLAEGGFGQALIHYGFCLRHGLGCAPAPEMGLTQYLTAAAQGNTTAFALLSSLFDTGDGAVAEPELAQAWAELASLRQFPGTKMPPANPDAHTLAEQIKANIQGLGPRIAALGVSPEDPQFPQQFAAAVNDNFAELKQPALSLDAGRRGTPAGPPADPVSGLLPETISWLPRRMIARRAASAECCIHLLANWPGPQQVGDVSLPLSALSPATHVLFQHLADLVHIPTIHCEAPVLSLLAGKSETPSWGLSQSDRLAKTRQGDPSGRRVLTTHLVLATEGSAVEAEFEQGERQSLNAGDCLIQYAVNPDGQRASEGVTRFRTEGHAWMLRIHVCERPCGVPA